MDPLLAEWLPTVFSIFNFLLIILGVVIVLRRPREPRAMLAWILAFVLLPVVGLILFFLIGEPKLERTKKKRRQRRQKLEPSLSQRTETILRAHTPQGVALLRPQLLHLVNLATRMTRQPPTRGNEVTIFQGAAETHQELENAIRGAKSHVHLEYYIFQPDETGCAVRDLLVQKAREGIPCRLLVDSIGCWNWPRSFRSSLTRGGVELAFFMPVVPWRGRWRVNFRNHRKLAVIDGKIGFTGSQNVGDEYVGRMKKYGPWLDTHLRVVGPAVQELQEIFVEDWHFSTQVDLVEEEYFPAPDLKGDQVVQVVPSGPDADAHILHHLLFAVIEAAERSLCIRTPYFVPDAVLLLALESAAYRGVRVELLVPSTTDHKLVLWAGRSFYDQLLAAGVEIYEYPGMLHSKVVVVDGSWAMVGSANMDERSFLINFEITTLLFDQKLAEALEKESDDLKKASRAVPPDAREKRRLGEQLLLGLARLASPIL